MRPITTVGIALTSVVAFAACSSHASSRPQTRLARPIANATADPAGTITVAGHGTIDGKPDVLTLMIGVDTSAGRAVDALSQNNTKANELIDSLKAAGIKPDDIQTSQLSVNPRWDDKGRAITGYTASNHVTAKVRDLDKAGALIDAAARRVGDAVRLDGITFSIDDTSRLIAEARADAVKRASDQARQLATAAGVKLGRIKSIDETNRNTPTPQYYAADAAMRSTAASVPIQAGTQELSIDVNVVYEIDQ